LVEAALPPQYPISTNLTTRSLVFLRWRVVMLVRGAGVPGGFTYGFPVEVFGCLVKRVL
jgi:hypothetical protein